MRKRLFSLLSVMATIFVLVGCGVPAGSETAQLAFEAQMQVDSAQRFHVSLGVRNVGQARFRDYQGFNAAMNLRDDAGKKLGSISVATLWELAPGNAGWPAAYASKLPAGAYQLTWGARDGDGIVVDFTIVELDGWLYLGEQRIQSTSGDMPQDGREYGSLQSLVDLARVNLAQKLGVEPEAVAVQAMEDAEFSDASLGIPEPDQIYAQILTPGHIIKLTVSGQSYEYRASDQRLVFVPGEGQAPQGDTTGDAGQTPDESHILFSYHRDGATEVWTLDPVSGAVEQRIRPDQTILDPAPSPLGDAVAYVRMTGDYGGVVSELWLMDRHGSNPRTLYVPPAAQSVLSRPAWQPDGQAIYVLRLGSEAASQLLRIPIHSGEPALVLADCIDFALSPDGDWLVSVSLDRELVLSAQDGSPLVDLTPEESDLTDFDSLAVSPSGDLLAFRATDGDTWNLYVMDLDTLDLRPLTDLAGFHSLDPSGGQVNGLAWTADGAHLVYSVDGYPEETGIWLVDIKGEEPQRLFVWEEGAWATVQGSWVEPFSLLSVLTVNESPIITASIDGPGHFEYKDRLGGDILTRIEGLRTFAIEQKLAHTNAVLAPFGYRLEARFDAEWNRTFHDLYHEGQAEPMLAGLSTVWPVSVTASGTDFVLVAENAPNVTPLYLQVQAGSVEPWDADLNAFLPPAYVGDELARITFSGFPTLTYQVELGNRVVYSGTAVAQGAYMPLRSLTTWDGHWVLEVDDHLIMDGQDLGESLGYDAAYGFSLIHGLPFYFFEQQGKVHISYNGQTLPNIYDQVFHNQCCERAIHNVEALGDVVLFHALRNGRWYFVEAGVYDGVRSRPIALRPAFRVAEGSARWLPEAKCLFNQLKATGM